MPKDLPFRQAVPISLEEVKRQSVFKKQAPGFGVVDITNVNTDSVLPGEPIVKLDLLGFSERAILPSYCGVMAVGGIREFRLNPDETEEIKEGDYVYWDYDLEDDDYVGYASSQQPTNGIRLGRAVLVPYDKDSMPVDYDGDPMASAVGSATIQVLCTTGTPTTYGTIPTI